MKIFLFLTAFLPLPALASTQVFYPTGKDAGKLLLSTVNDPNGFCTDGTRIRNRQGVVHFTCFGVNGTTTDAALILMKSSLGLHPRICFSFLDSQKSYKITLPTPMFYYKASDVGKVLDTSSAHFIDVRELSTVFDSSLECTKLPVDFVAPTQQQPAI